MKDTVELQEINIFFQGPGREMTSCYYVEDKGHGTLVSNS